jgi:hypothetical protein
VPSSYTAVAVPASYTAAAKPAAPARKNAMDLFGDDE